MIEVQRTVQYDGTTFVKGDELPVEICEAMGEPIIDSLEECGILRRVENEQ